MKKQTSTLKSVRVLSAALVSALALPGFAHAEDIDLFVSAATSSTLNNPNVLILLDNSSNWSSANQHWVGAGGESPFKQGQSELRAIRTVVQEATDKVNIGLMMFRSGSLPDGSYVRYAMRTMDTTNR
ncbi:MAG TPA: hypothetical protein VM756_14600, partial [Burkholderiales bacterium]|nr:hypothetical protein [Burkholderiales bacterium]